MTVDFKVEMKDATVADRADHANTAQSGSGSSARQQVSAKAKTYLEDHGVQPILQSMVHQLLAQQPQNPIKYMMDYLSCQLPEPAAPDDAPKATEEKKVEAEKLPKQDAIEDPPNHFAAIDGLGDQEYPGFPADECPESMPDLSRHFSLMTDVLKKDPGVWERLRDKTSSDGVPFAKCIKTGMDNRGHPMIKTIGLFAGSEDSYRMFKDVIDPIIKARHNGYEVDATHPTNLDYHTVSDQEVDPTGEYIISVKVRATRNVRGLKLLPAISKTERREVERVVSKGLLDLPDELQGQYYPLAFSQSYAPRSGGMSHDEEVMLKEKGFLFQEPDSVLLLSSGIGREWPDARGVFLSVEENVHVTVNEDDHICITTVSDQPKADLKETFTRFCKVEDTIHKALLSEGYDYMHNEHLGYLSTCPSRIGTAMHVYVLVKLPLLSACKDFKEMCKILRLQARGGIGHGLGSGTLDITNMDVLGSSEVDQVNSVMVGVSKLVMLEKKLKAGESLEDMLSMAVKGLDKTEEKEDSRIADRPTLEVHAPLRDFSVVPGLGSDEYPGFPTDLCLEPVPDFTGHHSLMVDVLKNDKDMYDKLSKKQTTQGVSLAKVIKPGMDNKGHPMIKTVGMVAGDAECYDVFKDLFDKVMDIRHGGFPADAKHSTDLDYSRVSSTPIDPSGKYVIWTRVRGGRNLAGLQMAPSITKEARREVERVGVKALVQFAGDVEGDYYPLVSSGSYVPKPFGMSEEEEALLLNKGYLFEEPDSSFQLSCGIGRHWPDARGVFLNSEETIMVWINEEEHFKLTAQRSSSDLKETFTQFCKLEAGLAGQLKSEGYEYMHHERLGFLASNPSNVGTGMRASVFAKLPELTAHPDKIKDICKSQGITLRAATGMMEVPWDEDDLQSVWELSTSSRLGTSEVESVSALIEGCALVVEMETKLENGES